MHILLYRHRLPGRPKGLETGKQDEMFGRTATKTVGKAAALGALLLAVLGWNAGPAQAGFVLEISGGLTTVTIADGGVGDVNGTAGRISFFGTIDGFSINLTTGISKPVIGTAEVAQLDLSSFQISGSAAGILTVRLTDTGYTSETVGAAVSAVGGNTQGTVSIQTYLDRDNAEFGTGDLLTDFGVLSGSGFSADDATAIDPSVNNDGLSPYSLTIVATVTHDIAGQVTGFDALLQTAVSEADVPAPASMAVFAFGLAALGALRRRRARG